MEIYIASNIKWDTDGADVKLPKRIEVKIPVDITDENDIVEYVSDYITEWSGFCHDGFALSKK